MIQTSQTVQYYVNKYVHITYIRVVVNLLSIYVDRDTILTLKKDTFSFGVNNASIHYVGGI